MKQVIKRSLAALLLLVMLVGYFSGITIRVSAASYKYNWGERGELATELSSDALSWYKSQGVTYAQLAALSGASSTSSVPSSALYTKLKSVMTKAHTYINAYKTNNTLLAYTDCQNGGGAISSFYSGKSIGPSWDGTWNKEHTWPNSKGLGGSDEDDVMMIRPTSTQENSSRGNTAYGQSSGYYNPNKESGGKYDLRGDCARICLYVYVRWGNTGKMWGSSGVMESKEVLLKWMEEDPVDTWELGRNDSVQSITGTRNVFVDYPELGFLLFNAEIPDGYQSPSGSAPSYTIVATSNNTSYGTVSMSGKTITATPKTGYQVSGYQVTSGTATVVRSGNTFTVTASSDCTIQIIFAARTKATLTFIDQGKTQTTLSPYTGDSVTMPTYTGTAPSGFVFLGWVEQQIANSQVKPAFYGASASYSVTGNKTFYALYAKSGDGSTGEQAYRLVTDISQLSQGASVVIAAGTTAVAMKQTGGTSNRYAGTVTKNFDDTVTFADSALIDVLTLGAGANTGTYSFFSQVNGKYLAAGTSTGSNILKLQDSVDAAASFTISVAADGTATITSQTSSDRKVLQYNSSANIFSCYASGQKAVSLYVSSGGGVEYYTTSPITCNHEDTENVAEVKPTCTESGYTAGVYCNDCDTYISGHEYVEDLGHSYNAGVVTTQPTCTAAGIKTFTCTVCGDTYTQSVAATGHDYEAVVTPPTATEQGYTTYTCGVCGDSYTGEFVYTVSFSVPSGVSAVPKMECGKNGIELPSADVPSDKYTFAGWTTEKLEDTDKAPATVYAAKSNFKATANTVLYALYTYVVGGSGTTEYVLTDIADIQSTDTVVVTMTYEDGTIYALDNGNGTSKAPTGVIVKAANNKLSAEPAENLLWNIGGKAGAYIFYPAGTTSTWLYCTSTNNGVRVGTTAANTFTIDADSGYLKHNGTNRYVGVYRTNPDWRCYTSTGVNINDQTLGFYVKGEAGTTYYTTMSPEEPAVESWSICLGDNIGVNFVINNAENISFTVAGKAVETAKDGDTYSIYLAAAQMTDEIVIFANGAALEETYSVRKYADTIIAGNYDEDIKNLVKAMLVYGGAAQIGFDYNSGNLASNGIAAGTAVPTGEDAVAVSDELATLNFYGASLVHKNKTAVRFYFSGSIEGLTFSQGEPVQKGDLYYIEVADINPQDIGDTIEIMVTDGSGNTLTVGYSPLTYIVRMYEKADASVSTKALVLALYNYYLAAQAYTN